MQLKQVSPQEVDKFVLSNFLLFFILCHDLCKYLHIVVTSGTVVRVADELSLQEMRLLNTYYAELETATVSDFLYVNCFLMKQSLQYADLSWTKSLIQMISLACLMSSIQRCARWGIR